MADEIDLEQDCALSIRVNNWPVPFDHRERTTLLDDNLNAAENQHEPSIFTQDDEGDTLLHCAILASSTDTALGMTAIMTPMELNVQNNMHQTPLHLAAHVSDTKVLKSLVEHGADMTMQDNLGRTAFHIICNKCESESLKTLSNYLKNNPNAISSQKMLKSLGIRDFEGQTCFHIACSQPNIENVKTLIDMGVDINCIESKSGKTGLHKASEIGQSSVVKLLVQNSDTELDVASFDGQTPLIAAYHRKKCNIVGILRNAGAVFSKRDISRFGRFRDEN